MAFGIRMKLNPLSHPIIFRKPERLSEVSEWQEHIPFAMLLVQLLQPKVLVELGTHAGDSYCAFCQAVSELELNTKCYAIDTWRGDPQTGFYGGSILDDLKAHHDPLYSGFSTLLQTTFDEAASRFETGEIDLLHIDGLHTYEAVRHDFVTWAPKMSERGIVLLHDTAEHDDDFGVWKLWEELSGRYPHFEFEHGHGLGMIAVGSVIPQDVLSILNATQDEALQIREFFAAVGRGWRLQSRYQHALRENSRLQDIVADLASIRQTAEVPAVEKRFDHPYGPDAAQDVVGYQKSRENSKSQRLARRRDLMAELKVAENIPTVSILLPVYKPPLQHFRSCVESVLNQTWRKWELCICDDASGRTDLDEYLNQLAASDERIKVARNSTNGGISDATNSALRMARGQYVTFLDHDDTLDPDALLEMVNELVRNPDIDVLYTDEDKIDDGGHHFAPYFKPDWSPDLLMSHAYMTHGFVIRTSLVEELGGLRSEFDGSQDYDLLLRATERAQKIVHIARVLYHWRTIEGSTALNELAKPWAHEAALRAVQAAMARRGQQGTVEAPYFRWSFRPRPRVHDDSLVSIIIPFREGADLLRRCVDSIHSLAGYEKWEALLVDNQSREPETKALLTRLGDDPNCRIVSYPKDFNWSAINNWAASQARGDYLLFLNNDIEAVSEGWLLAMLEHAQRKEVGAVGARLVYPDGRLQHGGVVIGMGRICAHAFWFCPHDRHAYFAMDKQIRNYSAVTGACMMVRKEVFDELGGFDERLRVAYNDIDYCLRAIEREYLIVYTPFAELMHFESSTRGISSDKPEEKLMLDRWLDWMKRGDPYYNPNLSLRRYDFGLPYESETPPWKDLLSELET